MKKRQIMVLILGVCILLQGCGTVKDKVSMRNENREMTEAVDVEQDTSSYIGSAGESYQRIDENQRQSAEEESMLTFSLKVDTASYSNVKRYINQEQLPPADAVRTEELINYFLYDEDMKLEEGTPFGIYTEIGNSPFDENKKLAFVRVKTKEVEKEELKGSNLTFLIDTSGSMSSYDKLPLLKSAFRLLVETLDEKDTVSIVTYAGSSEVVLDSANGMEKTKILDAINNLEAGGSTAGADGIMTAYKLAEKNKVRDGNNRIILASDGDFNVGISDVEELKTLINEKKEGGTYLSVLGFGTGNIRDDIMEALAANGNGNYSYIDTMDEANKVLIEEMGSNLYTIADDVKAQVEFNSANIKNYRLIGYENRMLENEDFRDDKVDAGEIGIGTDVVLMFELELNDSGNSDAAYADELFEVRIRYKNPGEDSSQEVDKVVAKDRILERNTSDFQFASSVAAFGHLLRSSGNTGDVTIDSVLEMAQKNLGDDPGGYRKEYIKMLQNYKNINNYYTEPVCIE